MSEKPPTNLHVGELPSSWVGYQDVPSHPEYLPEIPEADKAPEVAEEQASPETE